MKVHVFLIQRPQDKEPWPVVYMDLERAINAYGRVSQVESVELSEQWVKQALEREVQFTLRASTLCKDADSTDADIMRYAQRNPNVMCTNYVTGEPILFGGSKQS